jgi:hypothetical protein
MPPLQGSRAVSLYRLGDGVVKGEAVALESGVQGRVGKSCESRDLVEGSFGASEVEEHRCAPVPRLIQARGPCAVARAISKVVIKTLQGVPRRRPEPHVAQEHGEVMPLGTDADPSTAVEVKVWMPRVFAAPSHIFPGAVLRSGASFYGGSVCKRAATRRWHARSVA